MNQLISFNQHFWNEHIFSHITNIDDFMNCRLICKEIKRMIDSYFEKLFSHNKYVLNDFLKHKESLPKYYLTSNKFWRQKELDFTKKIKIYYYWEKGSQREFDYLQLMLKVNQCPITKINILKDIYEYFLYHPKFLNSKQIQYYKNLKSKLLEHKDTTDELKNILNKWNV